MRPHAIHSPADSREVSLTDDLFVPNAWREPMHRVLAGACERRSAMLLVSAEGRGKSTFLACLGPAASVLEVPTEVFIVEARQSTDWLAAAAAAFDLATAGLGRRDGLIAALRAGLSQRAAGGAQLIIAFDDADTLPRPALAEIVAFIAGWPSSQAPALILLTGTSDLAEQIAEVAPLREMQHWPRVSLAPWDLEDLTAYVRHRLARQRGDGHRFSPEALIRVHELSAGEPETVSRMVMTALSFARGASETTISHTAIEHVVTALYTDAPVADASTPRHDLRQRAGEVRRGRRSPWCRRWAHRSLQLIRWRGPALPTVPTLCRCPADCCPVKRWPVGHHSCAP
ncbi:ATP-binding protein [Defluviicoccus vanus]|uniref:ATP-binding protein n=1 Tax=Defluviicoccus vanus TaxID=111831 RepID=A0A7H1MZF6_9PROT|nr:ATP-binding protein [Defluviicoccus vanus]QNT68842.1 ATP-binding protein [Defluviicoccus vanus]